MDLSKQNNISILLKILVLVTVMLMSFMFIVPDKNTNAKNNNIYEKNIVSADDEVNDDNIEEKLSAVSVFKNNSSTITNINLQGRNIKVSDSTVCFYSSIEDKYSILEEICNSYVKELGLDVNNIDHIEVLGVITSDTEKDRISNLSESGEIAKEVYNAEVINSDLAGLRFKVSLKETETVEPEVVIEETTELLAGESETIKGVEGKNLLYKEITYYGLNKAEETTVKQDIITPVVNTIVKKGIKNPYEAGIAFLSKPTEGGYISSLFGEVRKSSVHKGIDIAKDLGANVNASLEGKVIQAGYNNGGYGNLIVLEHNNNMKTYYAHLSNIYVNVGDTVKQGDIIGAIGSTGNSTGPHLHFELRVNNEPVDPSKYIE
ncbi:peptidoglycan DD-metalloendopeptidase family protein [Clostridium sp. 1001271B_151109_B4]|uniref:peptidoglycan DD-metalloendopeptidase family protein n=1 Tax=Clostridium sp. 1001271B_151109_B4 TaxID=2787148 RepID=UPI0018A89715|nr:peptidoglycan DD-metalloendopeptidase family protein [Clostridium sp. 1001271B_151109_B4]